MRSDNDLINMLLVSADGQSLIPVVKKKGSKGGFSCMVLIENTLMLKLAETTFKGILLQVNIQNSYMPFT